MREMTAEQRNEMIAEFKKTEWYEPTLLRYQAHLKACDELDCPELKEPFVVFVAEVENAPTDRVRAEMLAIEPLEEYVPFQQYPAYIEPIMSEQKLDFYSAAMGRKLR